jgi:hypothetical protein
MRYFPVERSFRVFGMELRAQQYAVHLQQGRFDGDGVFSFSPIFKIKYLLPSSAIQGLSEKLDNLGESDSRATVEFFECTHENIEVESASLVVTDECGYKLKELAFLDAALLPSQMPAFARNPMGFHAQPRAKKSILEEGVKTNIHMKSNF